MKDTGLSEAHSVSPRLIAFFGPDGAGKSTQADLLANYLREDGFTVKRAWVRSTHTFAYLLWLVFYKLNLCDDRSGLQKKMQVGFAVSYLNENPYGAVSPITMSPPRLNGRFSRFVWSIAELAGIVPVVILQVYIPLLMKRVVVAERFVVDSIASIAYFLGDADFMKSWQAQFLLKLTPKGTVYIFIDADYDTILQRRGQAAGPRDYTNFHRSIYSVLSKRVKAYYANTAKNSVQDVNKEILHVVLNRKSSS